jgi:uncharacterized protein (TIGR03118 family)
MGRLRIGIELNPRNQNVKTHRHVRKLLALGLGILALPLIAGKLSAQFVQNNLVSDLPGMAAVTDSRLVNPWGISYAPTGPFWISDAGAGLSTLYNGAGTPQSLVVTIPSPGGSAPAVPTGQVFNTAASTGAFNGDLFIFASATGNIAGWRGALGTMAENLVLPATPDTSYLGVALGTIAASSYIYAANFGEGKIDVFPSTGALPLAGSFLDPGLPTGYAPFNVQNIGNTLFVTYALVGPDGDEVHAAGLGLIDRFDLSGNFLGRLVSNGGVLDAPWGLARAPAGFGTFGGDLLVGNFGDGTINAFDFTTGALAGTLRDLSGNQIVNDGVWGITFGNGAAAGNPNTLYITAGIQDETHGLFAAISSVPEPSTTGIFAGLGLVGLCAAARLRRAKTNRARS